MIPEHQNPDDSRCSNAPYNFIRLPEQIVPAQKLPDQNSYHAGLLTGRINCKLVTKTSIYTRSALRPKIFRSYDRINLKKIKDNADLLAYASFFHYDENGQPVISGSSLRGMIRAVAEVISYGKLQWVTDEPMMYRAAGSISSAGDSYRQRLLVPHRHKPLDYVPASLQDKAVIDLPEAVFGFIRGGIPKKNEPKEDTKRRGYAGRVFFSDATAEEGQQIPEGKLEIPEILSAPKPTSFQHYLTQKRDTEYLKGKELFHYEASTEETAIRGTKRYWHPGNDRMHPIFEELSKDIRPQDISQKVRKSRTVLRPVGSNTKFTFTVRFENLTPEELGMLLWAIELPAHPPAKKELCHQVGMAKPYGFGSVKITLRLFVENRRERYTTFCGDDGHWTGEPDTRPEQAGDDRAEFMRMFEQYVMRELNKANEPLEAQKRICDLTTMLQFPGPLGIRYLSMAEFRERLVLPTPAQAAGFPASIGEVRPVRGDGSDANHSPRQQNQTDQGNRPDRGNRTVDRGQPHASKTNPPQTRTSIGEELFDIWKKRGDKQE